MNDTMMTLVGNVVDTPKLRRTKNDYSVANFRVASTPRRFDRETNAWVDCPTLYLTVTCWRGLAENVGRSLFKGQPVVVTGRFYQRDYTQDEQPRTAYELEATSIGHDLSRGVADFVRTVRPAAVTVDTDEDGIPADHSDHYLDLVDPDEPGVVVDTTTGEVRELAGVS